MSNIASVRNQSTDGVLATIQVQATEGIVDFFQHIVSAIRRAFARRDDRTSVAEWK